MGAQVEAHVGETGVTRWRQHDGQGSATSAKPKVVQLEGGLRNRECGGVGVVLIDEGWVEFVGRRRGQHL